MADLKISELPALSGAGLAGADVLPLTDTSASTSKKITAKDLVQYGAQPDRSKLDPMTNSRSFKADGSVEELKLADNSVTALKLADNSSGVVGAGLPADDVLGLVRSQDTDVNKLYVWEGSSWMQVKDDSIGQCRPGRCFWPNRHCDYTDG